MKTKIQWKRVFALIIYLIFLVLSFAIIRFNYSIEYNLWQNMFFWITIFHLLITFFTLNVFSIKLYSVSGIFILLSYIFHLGQVILKGIENNYQYSFDLSLILDPEIYKSAVIFSLLIISMISIGVMLSKIFEGKSRNKIESKMNVSNKFLIKLGLVIFLITFPFEFYYSFTKLAVGLQEGYEGIFDLEENGFLSLFARFHLIGVALLIMGYSKQTKKSLIILLVYTFYLLITMLSGGRMYQIVSLVILMYIFIRSTKFKVNVKKVLLIFVVGFFLVTVINTIADIRSIKSRNFELVYSNFVKNLNNNPIYGALEEFGGSLYTVGLTILKVPNSFDYSHGFQFLTNFISVLPNVNSIFTEFNLSNNFVLLLNVPTIGGSFIAELFYSFKYVPYLVAIIIGILIGKVSEKLEHYLAQEQYLKVAYYIIPVFSLLLWVRGTSGVLYRNTILAIIFVYIITKFFIKKSN